MSSVTRSSCRRRGRRPRRLLAPPRVPRAVEEERLRAAELEHRGRHGLEEPAVVGDEDDRGVERRQLALEPLEALDVEVVRRLVEQQQVGIGREGARERGARQLAAGERVERPVEVGVGEPEAPERSTPRGRATPSHLRARAAPAPRCSAAASRRRGRRRPSPARAAAAPPRSRRGRPRPRASTPGTRGPGRAAGAGRAARSACPSRTRARRPAARSRRPAHGGASSCPRRSALRAPAGRPAAGGTRPRRRAGRRRTPCGARMRSARPSAEG